MNIWVDDINENMYIRKTLICLPPLRLNNNYIIIMGSSNDIICSIAENWQLDAMQENMCKYFFTHNDLSLIQNGKNCYVIGRKGSGISAICQYLVTDGQYV